MNLTGWRMRGSNPAAGQFNKEEPHHYFSYLFEKRRLFSKVHRALQRQPALNLCPTVYLVLLLCSAAAREHLHIEDFQTEYQYLDARRVFDEIFSSGTATVEILA